MRAVDNGIRCHAQSISRSRALCGLGWILGSVLSSGCVRNDDPGSHATAEPVAVLNWDNATELIPEIDNPFHQVADGVFCGNRIVVAERSSGTIYFFSSDGTLQQQMGRRGEGPGEFENLWWLQCQNDSVLAYDAVLHRITTIDNSGQIGKVSQLPRSIGAHTRLAALGVFPDGRVLMASRVQSSPNRPLGRTRTEAILLRVDVMTEQADSITVYHDKEQFVKPFGRAGQLSTVAIFARTGAAGIRGRELVIVGNDGEGVDIISPHDGTMSTWRPTGVSPAQDSVVASDIATARGRVAPSEPGPLNALDLFDEMPKPAVNPHYGWSGFPWEVMPILRTTSTGQVWVLHFGGIRSRVPNWSVMDSAGRDLGVVAASEPMAVLDVKAGNALVVRWDSLGAESVGLVRTGMVPED